MNRKNWWPTVYMAMFFVSALLTVRCIMTGDSRLPVAALCLAGSAAVYLREQYNQRKR